MARLDLGGRTRHRIKAGLGLREGDDLADVVLTRQDRHQPVDSHGEPAVGRRAEGERREEEAKAAVSLGRGDPERGKDPLLQLGLVDPDRTRAQLPAVEDQVVGAAAHCQRLCFDLVDIIGMRAGERMMAGLGTSGLRVDPHEQREVDDPDIAEPALADSRAPEIVAQLAEHLAHRRPLVRDQQEKITGLTTGGLHDPGELDGGQELRHRGLQRPVRADPHPHQTLGPELLGPVGQGVQRLAVVRGRTAGYADALHRGCPGERLEPARREDPGQLDKFQAETQIGFVHPEPVHGVVPGDPLDRRLRGAGDRLGRGQHRG